MSVEYPAFPPRRPKPDAKALKLIEAIRQWQLEDATEDEDELDLRDQERVKLHANLDNVRRQQDMRPLFPSQAQERENEA